MSLSSHLLICMHTHTHTHTHRHTTVVDIKITSNFFICGATKGTQSDGGGGGDGGDLGKSNSTLPPMKETMQVIHTTRARWQNNAITAVPTTHDRHRTIKPVPSCDYVKIGPQQVQPIPSKTNHTNYKNRHMTVTWLTACSSSIRPLTSAWRMSREWRHRTRACWCPICGPSWNSQGTLLASSHCRHPSHRLHRICPIASTQHHSTVV